MSAFIVTDLVPDAKQPKYEYTYTPLEEIGSVDSGRTNIYGVVKFVKYGGKSQLGTGFSLTMGLHNEALFATKDRFVVTIFNDFEKNLPVLSPGNIIRLHRVTIASFNGKLNGTCKMQSGCSWVVFDGGEADKVELLSSSCDKVKVILSEKDEHIVKQLREWIKRSDPHDTSRLPVSSAERASLPLVPCRTLSQLRLNEFCNITCQVIGRWSICDTQRVTKCLVLKVWDGTAPSLSLNIPDLIGISDPTLHECDVVRQLPSYVAHIIAYGHHVLRGQQLKIGGLYKFRGVHVKCYDSVGWPELYLHERNLDEAVLPSAAEIDAVIKNMLEAANDSFVIEITPQDVNQRFASLNKSDQNLCDSSEQVQPPSRIQSATLSTAQIVPTSLASMSHTTASVVNAPGPQRERSTGCNALCSAEGRGSQDERGHSPICSHREIAPTPGKDNSNRISASIQTNISVLGNPNYHRVFRTHLLVQGITYKTLADLYAIDDSDRPSLLTVSCKVVSCGDLMVEDRCQCGLRQQLYSSSVSGGSSQIANSKICWRCGGVLIRRIVTLVLGLMDSSVNQPISATVSQRSLEQLFGISLTEALDDICMYVTKIRRTIKALGDTTVSWCLESFRKKIHIVHTRISEDT